MERTLLLCLKMALTGMVVSAFLSACDPAYAAEHPPQNVAEELNGSAVVWDKTCDWQGKEVECLVLFKRETRMAYLVLYDRKLDPTNVYRVLPNGDVQPMWTRSDRAT